MEELTKHQEFHGGVVFAMSAVPQASPTLLLALTLQTDALAGVALTYTSALSLISQPQRYAYLDGPFGPQGKKGGRRDSKQFRRGERIPRDTRVSFT